MKIDNMVCDIVIPIFNSLAQVKDCVHSVLTCTEISDYRLLLINDASDNTTLTYLQSQAAQHPHITLYSNAENLGFVKSCNLGFSLGTNPYVLLLNSDVIVTPHWLPRLRACMEADNSIAAVNPLTNHAAQIDLPLAPGTNFYDMDWVLSQTETPRCLDVVTNVGFCLLLRRSALKQVGEFDEIYGHGYCEESDLCMRLTTRGYRTVVANNVYVYHQGNASFQDSSTRYLHNRRIFDSRWKKEYWRQFRAFRRADPLKSLRTQFALSQRWHPQPVLWKTYRNLLKKWKNNDVLGVAIESARGVKQALQARCANPDPVALATITRPQRLQVTYLLTKLVVAGGVLMVVQLVNQLILLGIEARIATLFVDPDIHHWRLLTAPLVFKDQTALIEQFPNSDIVVATHWQTVQWADQIVRQGKTKTNVYYLQDYESWFFPETDLIARQQVNMTYRLIAHKIVTSQWLQQLLHKDGYTSEKICIGTDLNTFYRRDIDKRSRPIILTMARPGTPWRGFATVIQALKQVKTDIPNAEIVFFGDNSLFKQKIPFIYRDEGIIFNQNRLAALYSEADVFLDGSDYQGFGLLALEAMACGVACVLTNVGGVNEYARHEENCLLIPPREPDDMAQAIIRLLQTPELKEKISKNGLATVKNYSIQEMAQKTLDFFNQCTNEW